MRANKILILILFCSMYLVVYSIVSQKINLAIANDEKEEQSCAQSILEEEHHLKEFYEDKDNHLVFTWKLNDEDVYAINYIHITKVRITFVDYYEHKPTIKFRWIRTEESNICKNLQRLINNKVIYVVITCREEEWLNRKNAI